jgi:predicted Fe-Mo cluster-binding NifX family protein
MRIAIPQWQGRISPVFDVAVSLLLIDVENGREIGRTEKHLPGADSLNRTPEFLNCRPDVLICGGISAPLEARLAASGVKVIGFTCGMIDEVLMAYMSGKLGSETFAMPGCRRWRRQQGGNIMPRGFGMGSGRGGGGRGQGRGRGQGAGRMGGAFAAGPGGFCVCPNCGEKAPHAAGQPCIQMVCPKCGTPMTRS